MIIFLFLASPVIAFIFSLSEYLGWWDKLFGRQKAIDGFDRMRFANGFPESFIYNDEQDKEIFNALEKRISKNTRDESLRQMLNQGNRPLVITVAGTPQPILGIPENWEQSARFFYPSEQPILLGFNWTRSGAKLDENQNSLAFRAGTLADLRDWLEQEKERRKFCVGTVIVSFISIGSILLRITLQP